jgi:hypothetical protein
VVLSEVVIFCSIVTGRFRSGSLGFFHRHAGINQTPALAAVPRGTAARSSIWHLAPVTARWPHQPEQRKGVMTSNKQQSEIRLLEDTELDHVFGGVNAGPVSNPLAAAAVGCAVAVGVGAAIAGAAGLIQSVISSL